MINYTQRKHINAHGSLMSVPSLKAKTYSQFNSLRKTSKRLQLNSSSDKPRQADLQFKLLRSRTESNNYRKIRRTHVIAMVLQATERLLEQKKIDHHSTNTPS
ncbi:hypothetical protein KC19_6G107300 [Ceratodon purpureus]|uniref:Uncharacterized protein n=1 Tax=Ceratodon purpureus TaxID=3225 RepID=A0A8T0HD39_CERPU|nr:hypothetical protein KC19_6G107300 [Ceratodon purpureus]